MKKFIIGLRTNTGPVDFFVDAEHIFAAHNAALNAYPGALIEFIDELN